MMGNNSPSSTVREGQGEVHDCDCGLGCVRMGVCSVARRRQGGGCGVPKEGRV